VPGIETRIYVDTGPVVERALARLSGIGWVGKNTCLIHQEKGSWFFLGVILTDFELPPDVPAPDRCGSCTRCLEVCPTGALVEPYVMDASRCIAYFNIELKNSIPQEFRTKIGANVFGCDICQDVCPWNNRPSPPIGDLLHRVGPESEVAVCTKRAATTGQPEFQPMTIPMASPGDAATVNEPSEDSSLFNPSLDSLARLTEDDFRKFFAHSPIKRVKYRGWLRNLCVVIGNSGDRRFIDWLKDVSSHPDAIVREHAEWALTQLEKKAE
jgi:epoxyqueuosine reductase